MVQFIGDGQEIARLSLSDDCGPRLSSRFKKLAAPKLEEHLLFERFMGWRTERMLAASQQIEDERHFVFFKLWDAFEQEGCPVLFVIGGPKLGGSSFFIVLSEKPFSETVSLGGQMGMPGLATHEKSMSKNSLSLN